MNNDKKKKIIIPLLLIILFGLFIGYGTLKILNSKTVAVVVPAKDIKAGTKISKDNIQIDFVSKNSLHPNAITDTELNKYLGKTALTTLYAREQILTDRVSDGLAKGTIKDMKDADKNFAVQIPIENEAAPTGIQPGDSVALIGTIQKDGDFTGVLGQNFRVINVNYGEEDKVTGITVEVAPEQITYVSQSLALGKVRVALISDQHVVKPIEGISTDELINNLKTAQ